MMFVIQVDGLEGLVGLRELALDKNKIKQLDESSFRSLVNLEELHLELSAHLSVVVTLTFHSSEKTFYAHWITCSP